MTFCFSHLMFSPKQIETRINESKGVTGRLLALMRSFSDLSDFSKFVGPAATTSPWSGGACQRGSNQDRQTRAKWRAEKQTSEEEGKRERERKKRWWRNDDDEKDETGATDMVSPKGLKGRCGRSAQPDWTGGRSAIPLGSAVKAEASRSAGCKRAREEKDTLRRRRRSSSQLSKGRLAHECADF